MKQQMAMSSLESGRQGELKVRSLLDEHGCRYLRGMTARINDPTGTNKSGFLHPDFLATISECEWVIEVKSNGLQKGTMYNKWVYQALRHSLTGRKTLFVFDLAEPSIFEAELRFLQQAVPSFNIEYVLLPELNEWLTQKCAAPSQTALRPTAAPTTSTPHPQASLSF